MIAVELERVREQRGRGEADPAAGEGATRSLARGDGADLRSVPERRREAAERGAHRAEEQQIERLIGGEAEIFREEERRERGAEADAVDQPEPSLAIRVGDH